MGHHALTCRIPKWLGRIDIDFSKLVSEELNPGLTDLHCHTAKRSKLGRLPILSRVRLSLYSLLAASVRRAGEQDDIGAAG